ncbi:hypothetical protein AAFF_G00067340 [Aldrovandia affinis]|uniref:SH2 domain-containing protein n=1 Tax=Aldrovandia affinis TaxID=143900 RepID=A0AAD7T4A5_9TELE|nr:hypothetical protein AAFF_G00067340 [Aldrovandia affinis]
MWFIFSDEYGDTYEAPPCERPALKVPPRQVEEDVYLERTPAPDHSRQAPPPRPAKIKPTGKASKQERVHDTEETYIDPNVKKPPQINREEKPGKKSAPSRPIPVTVPTPTHSLEEDVYLDPNEGQGDSDDLYLEPNEACLPLPRGAVRKPPPPKTMNREAPTPKTMNREAPPPKTMNREAPPPKTMNREAPPPRTGPREAPPPKTMNREAPPPRTGPREAPPPKTMNREAPPPKTGPREAPPPRTGPREALPSKTMNREAPPPKTGPREAPPPKTMNREAPPPRTGPREAPPPVKKPPVPRAPSSTHLPGDGKAAPPPEIKRLPQPPPSPGMNPYLPQSLSKPSPPLPPQADSAAGGKGFQGEQGPESHSPNAALLSGTEEWRLQDKEWFGGNCDRKAAEAVLFRVNKDGAFLVRRSSTNAWQPYTLVVLYKQKVYNIPVRFLEETHGYALGKENEEYFHSLQEIISHYKNKPLLLIDSKSHAKHTTNLTHPARP